MYSIGKTKSQGRTHRPSGKPKHYKIMNKLFIGVGLMLCAACASQQAGTEKFYKDWDKTTDVRTHVHEIDMDSVLIHANSTPYIAGRYLLIADAQSTGSLIQAFDKNDFRYLGSFVRQGEGPNAITRLGSLGINGDRQPIYLTDYGKMKIFACHVDSALHDSAYTLREVAPMNPAQFPADFTLTDDSLGIGRFIIPTSNSDYRPRVAKWNLFTGKCEPMPYEYPDIAHKHITCGVSPRDKVYAECYDNVDLMTLCDFDGKLLCNIHGPAWDADSQQPMHYYSNAVFRKGQVIAAYSGGDKRTDDYYPTRFQVFDLEGNYLKTLDVGYKILRYCYDEANDRLIICFNDAIQYGYIDLKDLL